ncbi:MAG: acetate--CoA ligase [Desulfuromonas sp.]|nr:MAG: acetate--CoA ligase [Desulfuromonas sp.]
MDWHAIEKNPSTFQVPPNLPDYCAARAEFTWDDVRQELAGLPDGRGLNIAHEAVDRHVAAGQGEKIALRWLGKSGTVADYTYAELQAWTNRFANLLQRLGIGRGERVFSLSTRVPELYFAALGTLKNTSVFCPLFAAFGPEPIAQRLERGNARVLVTSERLYRKKVAGLRDKLPQLDYVLLTDSDEDQEETVLSLSRLLAEASPAFIIPPTHPEDMALLHFTSGTTGKPKGAIHVHNAVLTHYLTGKYVLDLHPDDIFWCTADCGWVTGTSYGIIAPLLQGVTNIVDEADFESERWFRILEEQRVSVWYTAPTAVRMLMRSGLKPCEKYDLSALRLVHSVGEPLNPEAVIWGEVALGLPIHDNWWQTETGGIMIANYAAMDIRPGSMGRPLPGIEAAIIQRTADGGLEIVKEPNVEGELALRSGWPSMFRGYLHDEERYHKCFIGDWYISGDLAERDADGYFWFIGRADDIIKTSGHMVGPFEVESVLLEHPAVAEAGVIGVPEATIGELVKAFVALKPGYEPNEELNLELLGFARKKLGSAVAPKVIAFTETLPKTRSGKIMRRLLKARELGLPEGDTSTLEENK